VKMRKTYKNKVKDFGISGNFDSIKKERESPDSMFMMMIAPQQEWDVEHTRGKEIEKGLDSVLGSMGKAFTMAKGKIPKSRWNSVVLGEVAASVPQTQPMPQNGVKTPVPNSGAPGTQRPKSELPRPKRNVKKRTYGDSSYEGYGEGYVDDDAHETGYSTNDGDERGMGRKRPKKVCILLEMHAAELDADNYKDCTRSLSRPSSSAEQLWSWYGWSLSFAVRKILGGPIKLRLCKSALAQLIDCR
jgi:hypothetical protein